MPLANITYQDFTGENFFYDNTESSFWQNVGKRLLGIQIPNRISVSCPNGTAELIVKQRGTYTENGIKKPSMYVTVTNQQKASIKKRTLPASTRTAITIKPISCVLLETSFLPITARWIKSPRAKQKLYKPLTKVSCIGFVIMRNFPKAIPTKVNSCWQMIATIQPFPHSRLILTE